MGSTKQKTTSSGTTSGTTTPNVPGFAQAPVSNYFDQVGQFGAGLAQNPNQFATPANSLQQQAYSSAINLPNGGSGIQHSNALAAQAGNAMAPTYTAPTIAPVERAGGAQLGSASQATLTQAEAERLGPAAQAALAQAQAVKAGPAASLLDNFASYANPVTDELVTKNLSAYDEGAQRNTAASQAAMARAGAFGGSRAGIAQAQLASEQASGRGLLSANLRSSAFDKQAGLAEADAGRRQQTGMFDAGNAQQTNWNNAGWANQNNQFNTGQINDFTKTQASLNQQATLQNAAAANQNSQFNVGQANGFTQAQAGLNQQTSLANAAAANSQAQQQAALQAQGGMFNVNSQQQQLDRNLSAAGLLSSNAGLSSNIANNNLAAQMSAGNNMQSIDRQNQLAGLAGLQAYGGLLDPSLYSQFVGQSMTGTESGTSTAKNSGGLLGQLIGAGAQVGSAYFMSERRVKRDIELIGRESDGLGVFRYNYIFDGADVPVRTGVMVDEVERLRPWALGPIINGIRHVDYSQLEIA